MNPDIPSLLAGAVRALINVLLRQCGTDFCPIASTRQSPSQMFQTLYSKNGSYFSEQRIEREKADTLSCNLVRSFSQSSVMVSCPQHFGRDLYILAHQLLQSNFKIL